MGSQVPTLQKLTSVQKKTRAQHVWKAPPRPRGQPCPRLCGGSPLCGEEADYSHLDIVETGFRYIDIEDESCRLKTICELESYAVSHPLASLAINTINSNLRGLDRYQTAIQAGINGEDCALIYDQCRVSYVGY